LSKNSFLYPYPLSLYIELDIKTISVIIRVQASVIIYIRTETSQRFENAAHIALRHVQLVSQITIGTCLTFLDMFMNVFHPSSAFFGDDDVGGGDFI
jgi:hypothetical protein